MAMANPWSDAALGACVPVLAGKTHKVCCHTRFASAIGTQGYAFILASPVTTHDMPALTYSNSLYTGIVAAPYSATDVYAVGVSTAYLSTLPFYAGQLTGSEADAGATSRLVSASLRITYTGTTLNQSGQVYSLRNPDHNSVQFEEVGGVATAASPGLWGVRRETQIRPFDRKRASITDHAINIHEMQVNMYDSEEKSSVIATRAAVLYPYSKGVTQFVTAAGVPVSFAVFANYHVGVPTMGFQIVGKAGEPFHVEYIQHVEYGGRLSQASATETETDHEGAMKVNEALNRTSVKRHALPDSGGWPVVLNALKEVEKEAQSVLVPAAESAVERLLS